MVPSKVTKCICHKRTFEEIMKYAQDHGYSTVEELQKDNFCSSSCGLCIPYIEITLKEGQTEFLPGEPYGREQSSQS